MNKQSGNMAVVKKVRNIVSKYKLANLNMEAEHAQCQLSAAMCGALEEVRDQELLDLSSEGHQWRAIGLFSPSLDRPGAEVVLDWLNYATRDPRYIQNKKKRLSRAR
jgi:hypothetical protein